MMKLLPSAALAVLMQTAALAQTVVKPDRDVPALPKSKADIAADYHEGVRAKKSALSESQSEKALSYSKDKKQSSCSRSDPGDPASAQCLPLNKPK
jgi:hypothetical protein